jgi:hypothetical protein
VDQAERQARRWLLGGGRVSSCSSETTGGAGQLVPVVALGGPKGKG